MEIKSAATFTVDHLRGLQALLRVGLPDLGPGTVLYICEHRFVVDGVTVLNPLDVDDLFTTVTLFPVNVWYPIFGNFGRIELPRNRDHIVVVVAAEAVVNGEGAPFSTNPQPSPG